MKKLKIFIFFIFFVCVNTVASDMSVITSNNNSTVTKYEVRQLFLMKKKRLSTGELIVLVQMNSKTSLHKMFVREILDISIEEYNQIIESGNNSGNGSNIITVNTKEEMISKVMGIQNSIGYIDNDYLIINSLNNIINIYKIVE